MRIAIDGRAIAWTGIGRYVRNLVRSLAEIDSEDEYVVLVGDRDLAQVKSDASLQNPKIHWQVVEPAYYSWREQVILPAQLARIRADLFHFTHFNAPISFHRPYVVTIHDTTRFIFSGQTKQSLLSQLAYEYIFARTLQRAAGVIAVSQATRGELEKLSLQLPSSVVVIPEGVEAEFFAASDERARQAVRAFLQTDAPYLLYVGVWMEHKNLRRLLMAFREVLRRYPRFQLVITGEARPGYVDVPQLARVAGVARNIVLPGFVEASLLPALYQEAQACVFPSLYEGFGLPALEAAAAGVPVITSQVASLPEVMGQAARYVNPESVSDIQRGIEQVLGDRALAALLAERGQARARQFSWAAMAAAHWSLYRSVIY